MSTLSMSAPVATRTVRVRSPRTLAWSAFVKMCITDMPHIFAGMTKMSDKLVVVKGIRAENPVGYKAFHETWLAYNESGSPHAYTAAALAYHVLYEDEEEEEEEREDVDLQNEVQPDKDEDPVNV